MEKTCIVDVNLVPVASTLPYQVLRLVRTRTVWTHNRETSVLVPAVLLPTWTRKPCTTGECSHYDHHYKHRITTLGCNWDTSAGNQNNQLPIFSLPSKTLVAVPLEESAPHCYPLLAEVVLSPRFLYIFFPRATDCQYMYVPLSPCGLFSPK